MNVAMLLVSLFTFVEINCENLFDFTHDSLKQDSEFVLGGIRGWNPRKYRLKLDNVSRMIASCGVYDGRLSSPDMLVLCEIENDSVARDLARRVRPDGQRYDYVITDSPDLRGIDVALFWLEGSFKMISHSSLRITPLEGMRPTRDILYVSGTVISGDTLHVFAVHAPSRYGGEKATVSHRKAVTSRLAQAVDSIRAVRSDAKIIIAGDFNDYHDSPPLQVLYDRGLVNVSKDAAGSHGACGTYKYKGKWDSLDQIIVSSAIKPLMERCYINDAPFLLVDDEQYGGVKPFRTSNGYKFQNGYSDHLPLVLRLRF